MDITEVRPAIKNLRARAIDGKSQMLIWDKPVGGLLIGYSIRFRIDGEQGEWQDILRSDVHWGDTHHAAVVPMPSADPGEVVVGVRAVNLHRHSSPAPETHLAADYKVLLGDNRHQEPRLNQAPNRPYLFMTSKLEQESPRLSADDLKRRENLFEWATQPAEWLFTNRTQEEIAFFCNRRGARRTLRPRRAVVGLADSVSDTPIAHDAVDAQIGCFDYEPDLLILTTVRGSFTSLSLPGLEHPVDQIPEWARDLQQIGPDLNVHRPTGRTFQPFDQNVPGCWGVATRVVAACETNDRTWFAQCDDHILQACGECWDGRIVGGYIRAGVSAFCFRDFNHGLVVQVEYRDGRPKRSCTFTSPHLA